MTQANDDRDLAGLEKRLQIFLNSPAAKAAAAADEAEIDANRNRIATRLADLAKASDAELRLLDEQVKEALKNHEAAVKRLAETTRTVGVVSGNRHSALWRFIVERNDMEHALNVSAPDELRVFIEEIHNLTEIVQHSGLQTANVETRERPWGGQNRVITTNARAIRAFLETLVAIRDAANLLRLVPDRNRITREIAELRKKICDFRNLPLEEVVIEPPTFMKSVN